MQIFWNLRLATSVLLPGLPSVAPIHPPRLRHPSRGEWYRLPLLDLASPSTRGILRHLPNFVYLSLFWFPLVEGKPQQSREQHRESGARGSSKQQKTPTHEGRSNLFFEILELLWCKAHKWNNLFLNTRRYITTWMFWYGKDDSIFYKNHMRSFLPINNIAKKC